MARATRTTQEFLRAEQETADWQAAQDAHVFERQFRLSQTTRMALPMLQRVIEQDGDLTDAERAECLHLEQAIRDEIRGRALLSDDVRDEVMRLRRRGATVQLHDDGGLDDLEMDDLRRVHAEIADALRRARDADNVIVRTVGEGSDAAVTIVGLRLDTRRASPRHSVPVPTTMTTRRLRGALDRDPAPRGGLRTLARRDETEPTVVRKRGTGRSRGAGPFTTRA